MIVIDGEKFIGLIGLGRSTLTSEIVAQRLLELGKEEVNKIIMKCTLEIMVPSVPLFIDKYREELENGKCFLQPITSGESYGSPCEIKKSPCEIKRRLKYCKNPMERMKLQRELNSAYKHYDGYW